MGVARENVSWPRSRVTTLRTAAPRPARFPPWRRGKRETRLVSLSLITILCVVVDDEGRRRASGPVYRQQERSGQCACVPAPCRAVRARAHAHVRVSTNSPFFFIFFPPSCLSPFLTGYLSLFLSLSLPPSFPPLFPRPSRSLPLFLFAPLLCQNARVRVCEEQH